MLLIAILLAVSIYASLKILIILTVNLAQLPPHCRLSPSSTTPAPH
jgi:hypothetical protein